MMTYGKSLRVLIVDDNRDGADALGLLVEGLGHEVRVTYGGRQALEVATTFLPNLMLVDLAMPDIGGFDLVVQIRQMPAFFNIKIVAVTGYKKEGHKTLALNSGCDAVLVKPAGLTEIKAVLGSVAAVEKLPYQIPRQMSGHDKF